MAHTPIFEVTVESWSEEKNAKPRRVAAVCTSCAAKFRATEGPRAGDDAFASYLGAIHLHCPRCDAEGPVPIRRLKRSTA